MDAYAGPHWQRYTSDGVIPYREFERGEAQMAAGAARQRLTLALGVAHGAALAFNGADPKVDRATTRLQESAFPTLPLTSDAEDR